MISLIVGVSDKAKVRDNSKKTFGKIFDFNARLFRDVSNSIGKDCEHDVALMKDVVVFKIVQERNGRSPQLEVIFLRKRGLGFCLLVQINWFGCCMESPLVMGPGCFRWLEQLRGVVHSQGG